MSESKTIEQILKDQLKGVKIIYGIVRHVSKSGMSRVISFHYYDKKDGRMLQLNWGFGELLGLKQHDKYIGLKIEGGGMDMIFATIYSAASLLYPKDKRKGYRFQTEQL